jgi:hypothetical protein
MLNIVCMLMGEDIPDIYVRRLASMLERHVHVPFRLHCITDRARPLPDGVCVIDSSSWKDMRREGMRITTNKIRLFDPEWLPFEEFLYMDVTLVIQRDMKSLLDHCLNSPLDLITVRDWGYDTYNSCVMRIRKSAHLHKIYQMFQEGKTYKQHTPGDQDFVHACIRELGMQDRVGFFQPDHVVSFKMLRILHRKDPNKAYEQIRRATIVKFHGRDKMHLLLNPSYRFFKVVLRHLNTGARDASFWLTELRANWR